MQGLFKSAPNPPPHLHADLNRPCVPQASYTARSEARQFAAAQGPSSSKPRTLPAGRARQSLAPRLTQTARPAPARAAPLASSSTAPPVASAELGPSRLSPGSLPARAAIWGHSLPPLGPSPTPHARFAARGPTRTHQGRAATPHASAVSQDHSPQGEACPPVSPALFAGRAPSRQRPALRDRPRADSVTRGPTRPPQGRMVIPLACCA
jgi:hypothetical protein